MFKNTGSQKITLLAIDTTTNAPKTGDAANLTAYVSKDDGAVTALTDTSATEKDATNAPGLYDFDVTQTESNADKLVFSAKSSTANIKLIPVTIYTRAANVNDLVIDGSGNLTANITGTLSTVTTLTNLPAITANWLTAAGTAADFSTEIRTAINGGDYALSTDANGRIRIVDGTGVGELDTASGRVLADLTHVGGTAVTSTAGFLRVLLADRTDHGGTAAVITFERMIGASTTVDASCVKFTGNGLGGGLELAGTKSLWLNSSTGSALRADGAIFLRNLNGGGVYIEGTSFGVDIKGTAGPAMLIDSDFDDAIEIVSGAGSALSLSGTVSDIKLVNSTAPTLRDAILTAGSITSAVAPNLDAAVSTRASQASVDTIDDFLDTEIATIISRIGVPASSLAADIAALNDLSAAEVNAEVVDALATDTYAEPGQGAPGAMISLAAKINWLYTSWRNKKDNDGTTTNLYADNGSTIIAKQGTSIPVAGTVQKAEWITGA